MSFIPKKHEIYKHFQGNCYEIIAIAENSETGEDLVVYEALYGEHRIYARPLEMFTERVDREKYPEVTQEFRFALQSDAESDECKEEQIDSTVLAFLEAESYEDKLRILEWERPMITDEMITTMAIASDVEVTEGELETRYESLRNCLQTLARFEGTHLR